MFSAIQRRTYGDSSLPFNPEDNPYKAHRAWPPDFSKLDPKLQFRLERKYRRRSKLKLSPPGWTKAVKLSAWGSCTGGSFWNTGHWQVNNHFPAVLVYGVLFMDWGDEKQPFQGVSLSQWIWYTKNQGSGCVPKGLQNYRYGPGFGIRPPRSGRQTLWPRLARSLPKWRVAIHILRVCTFLEALLYFSLIYLATSTQPRGSITNILVTSWEDADKPQLMKMLL